MKNYSGLYGMYQPDSISSYEVSGAVYLVTANEGDGREYADDDNTYYINEAKIKNLDLDDSIASEYEMKTKTI